MDELSRLMLAKLIQCILQSRIKVQKKQIRHFDQINKQIQQQHKIQQQKQLTNSSSRLSQIHKFLNSLLLLQKYNISQLLQKPTHNHHICIIFKLINNKTNQQTISQVWIIQFQQYRQQKQQQIDDLQQQLNIIKIIFEQLILFLNRQPLFAEYQRNTKLKNNYRIDFMLKINQQNKGQPYCITGIAYKHSKQRLCHWLHIKLQCYYLDTLLDLPDIQDNKHIEQYQVKKQQAQTADNDKLNTQHTGQYDKNNRKHSIYEYYDKQLDFVFLASDDETFKNKKNVKQIDIANYVDDTDQFQLLMISQDQLFIDQNKSIFTQLANAQTAYFIP